MWQAGECGDCGKVRLALDVAMYCKELSKRKATFSQMGTQLGTDAQLAPKASLPPFLNVNGNRDFS